MRVDLFDFDLPEDRIALRPCEPRDSSRLLRVEAGQPLTDHRARDLPELLRAGDLLIFNDTKVIPAQLEGTRTRNNSTAKIGATLHMRLTPNKWAAFVRGAKKLKAGDVVQFSKTSAQTETELLATVLETRNGGEIVFSFDKAGADLDAALTQIGHIPLPPYIALKRGEDERDRTDYQTIYAREEGAVAAPTAGLHFTDNLLSRLDEAGVGRGFVTLHVGAGTFLPVKADDTDEHQMHAEIGEISDTVSDQINETRQKGGRIVCVGTTSMRLLESAADENGNMRPWRGATDIFITPGYRFKIVDMLMTNFHLPRSTLFMLVSAFAGLSTMRAAYAHAIEKQYRFYSYGDTSLLSLNRDAASEVTDG